jgi:hypothetical protein
MEGKLGTKYGQGGNTAGGERGTQSVGDNTRHFHVKVENSGCLSSLMAVLGIFTIAGTVWYMLS